MARRLPGGGMEVGMKRVSSNSVSNKNVRLAAAWCALVWCGCVVMGTLVPFSFDCAMGGSGELFGLGRLGWHHSSVSDVVANVLVYVPVGAGISLFLSGRVGSLLLRLLAGLGGGLLLSVGLEWLQTMMSFRVASWVDVCMNGVGALAGAGLVIGVRGVLVWTWRWLVSEVHTRPLPCCVTALTLGVLAYNLVPFDVVVSTEGLWDSLRASRIQPSLYEVGIEDWTDWAGYAGQLGLIGFLSVLGLRSGGNTLRRSVWRGLGHVAVLALLIEVLQLFVQSHAFDVMDGLAGLCGGAAGAAAAGLVLGCGAAPSLRGVVVTVLIGQVLYLFAANAAPFDLSWGHVDVSRVTALPFWGYFMRPFGAAMGVLLEKTVTFGVLAGSLWLLLGGTGRLVRSACVVSGVVLVASGCEFLELLTSSRHADVTDPMIALGVAVAVVLVEPFRVRVAAAAGRGS